MGTGHKNTIWRQVRRNAVAIISLVIALSTLSYSTWRNEKSEDNRNHRQAAFEILLKLNELQQVIFHRRYDQDATIRGNPRLGWTIVLTIDDLSQLLESPIPENSLKVKQAWSDSWEDLGESQEAVDMVLEQIDEMRGNTLNLLRSLE
ncbi:Uncharacterised protein [Halioglobus japonicus]|nr:Uncharacterised protein [Halioglobus japonicus]